MIEKYKIDLDVLKHVESWKAFDDNFTLHIHPNYKTVSDYYYNSSCLTKVRGIKVPTLVIHSKDDPIVPIDCLPMDECLANENIIVGIVRSGGHVCYF
jgi:predicted alpha/beta-fold hydrolase